MDNVARLDSSRRGELFAETADRLRLSDTVVEKDFWVCWTLKQIFSIDALKNTLLFKGGTSLSKIFRAINRFSEDIDLAVDYAALGSSAHVIQDKKGFQEQSRTKSWKRCSVRVAYIFGTNFFLC